MNKKRILLILLILTIPLTNGCWDRRELESLGIVQALGLDLAPDEMGVTVTTMIAIPSMLGGGQEGGGGGGDEPGVLLISMDAPSIYEAFNKINTMVNREISLLQNQILLIGEEMAKSGVEKWIDNLIRYREMRRTMLIFICKGKAAEIMQVQPKLENKPSEYFVDLVSISRRTGMFPLVTLNDFFKRYGSYAQENYLPLIDKQRENKGGQEASKGEKGEEGGKKEEASSPGQGQADPKKKEEKPEHLRFIGSAIFKKDRMVGDFDIYETQILLLLTNEFKEAFLTIEDPLKKGTYIIFRLLSSVPVQIRYQRQNRDFFTVKLRLEANLISIQSGIDYTQPKLEGFLGRVIAEELKNRIVKVIKKAQQEYESDVFGFGDKVKRTFLTSNEYENYRWPDKFKDSEVDVEVQVELRRVGVQFQPPENR